LDTLFPAFITYLIRGHLGVTHALGTPHYLYKIPPVDFGYH